MTSRTKIGFGLVGASAVVSCFQPDSDGLDLLPASTSGKLASLLGFAGVGLLIFQGVQHLRGK